ncbi:MAG: DNA primase [Eubacterium sp.]|nr:DNA primase [Eubacterium sp.]
MYYPEEVIEEVRARNDIVDVISSYVGLKRVGSNFTCCCPFHSEKTPSFSVSRQKQMFYCFGCHEGGNVFSFIMKYEHFTFPEASKYPAERVGYSLPEVEPSEEEKKRANRKQQLRDVNNAVAAYFHYILTKTERGKLGYAYFTEKRGFTDKTIAEFGLGFADIYSDDLYKYLKKRGFSDQVMRDAGLVDFDERQGPHDKFWNRVMVPILDMNSKCIAFGGRVLGDAKPKYLNTRETELFDKSHNLFALYRAKRSKRRGMILCEGYMDVITQHQAGFDNAIASLGTAFTPGQAALIKRYTKEVYLAYDSDAAGTKAALKAIKILRDHDIQQRVVDLSPHKDPDEFLSAEGPDAYEDRLRNAISGRMFEIRRAAGEYRLGDPEEKTAFIHAVARIIAGSPDVAARASYIETVAGEYGLPPEILQQEVSRIGLSGLDTQTSSEEGDSENEGVPYRSPDTGQSRKYRDTELKEDRAETRLLTWMVNRPELFKTLAPHISEEDFTGRTREVAEQLFRQYKETGNVNPAALLNRYEESEDQRVIAGIMSNELPFEADADSAGKALTELVRKVKLKAVDEKLRAGEGSAIELARKKKEIQRIVIHV